MRPIVIIPARMAATRLPGKPLADIGGESMIVRVMRQAQKAAIGEVVVAAGDHDIFDAVERAGGRAILTAPDLPSGSDRILAALRQIDQEGRYDAVINLQGDMPFVDPAILTACVGLLADHADCDIATVVAAEAAPEDRANPNAVKAVLAMQPDGRAGRALYFTRSTLYGDGPAWIHAGIYGYRRAALERFAAAPPSPLERREKLEQLRALEMGLSIWAAVADAPLIQVDSAADLEAARAHAKAVS